MNRMNRVEAEYDLESVAGQPVGIAGLLYLYDEVLQLSFFGCCLAGEQGHRRGRRDSIRWSESNESMIRIDRRLMA
jgi:hypothetical protein